MAGSSLPHPSCPLAEWAGIDFGILLLFGVRRGVFFILSC